MNEEIAKLDEDKLTDYIRLIMEQIELYEDVHSLTFYRNIIKKEVSIFRRSYFVAFLLKHFDPLSYPLNVKQAEQPYKGKVQHNKDNSIDSAKKKNDKKKTDKNGKLEHREREIKKSPEGYQTLFISAGKRRQMYNKVLRNLLTAQNITGLTDKNVLNVKIFDTYSFCDVPKSCVEYVIKALNESEFRGRKLIVSLSRK